MTLNAAADLIDKAIQYVALKKTNLEEENYRKYYNVSSTEDYYTKDSSLTAYGEAARITENAVIVSESPVQGYDRTLTLAFYLA